MGRVACAVTAVLLAAGVVGLLVAGPTTSRAHEPRVHGTHAAEAYLLLIHGGSWYRTDRRVVGRMAANRPRLHAWGYRTDLVHYRPRRQAFPDVLRAYDRLRQRVGAHAPICAYGSSAGAQMALMLAIRRPDVACVVSEAAPTELQRIGPYLRRRARAAFGDVRLARWSPALYRLMTPTLLEQGTSDHIVPFSQMALMRRAAPHSRAIALGPGTAPFIHTHVNPRQLAHARTVERRFLREAISRWRRSGPYPPARYID